MRLRGAMLGGMFAKAGAAALLAYWGHAQVLAVLGMAAFFVGSVRAPLTGIVLISEMTGGYDLLFPLCLACLAALPVAEVLRDRPSYDALVEGGLARSGHAWPRTGPGAVCIR